MRIVAAAAVAVAFSLPAAAADLYAPPPISDPVYAPAPMSVVGHLDLGLGYGKWDAYSDGNGLFEGAGRANIPFHNGWNLQIETGGVAGFEDGYSQATLGAAAHIWNRGQSGALGVFGGANFGATSGSSTQGFVGLEGELEVGQNVVFGAQASYGFGHYDHHYWNVRGWGSYYFTSDTKLRGEVVYQSENRGVKGWDLSAELEHRFTGSPLSAFGKVAYTSADYYGDRHNAWRGLVGARLFIDQQGTTLRDHDRQVPWDVRQIALPADR